MGSIFTLCVLPIKKLSSKPTAASVTAKYKSLNIAVTGVGFDTIKPNKVPHTTQTKILIFKVILFFINLLLFYSCAILLKTRNPITPKNVFSLNQKPLTTLY